MNTAKLSVSLQWQGRRQAVQSLQARESLNAPMWAEVEVDPLPGVLPESLTGMAMQLRVPGNDGGVRQLQGQVVSARVGERWVLTLRSRLWQGHLQQKSRLFPELSRRQVVQQLLDDIGYARDEVDWRLDAPMHEGLPPAPLLQAAESHLDCFNRLLSEAGWNYWFADTGTGRECLVISDRTYYMPLDVPAMTLPPLTGSHGVGEINQLVKIGFNAKLQAQGVRHSCQLQGPHYQGTGRGHWQTFAPPLPPEAAARRVKQQNQRLQHNVEHHLVTLQPRLQPGQTLRLQPGALPLGHPPLDQQVIILSVEHHASQPHQDHPGQLSYHNVVTACNSQQIPYPTPLTVPKKHPLVFPATIWGASGPQPDSRGEYAFSSFNQPDVRSRYPGLLLRPSAGEAAGWHFPLLGGTQVLITFVNGDPNQPLILGVLPHLSAPGPVTNKNAGQHRLITPAQNELTLEDGANAEDAANSPCIRLQSLSEELHLELNANEAEPFLRLAAHYGAISLDAAKQLYLKASGQSRQHIKESRSTQVMNQHTSSAQGARHWQSARHLQTQAKAEHQQRAGQHIQLQSGQTLHLKAEHQLHIRSANGHQIRVPQGSVITQAMGNLTIEGNGQGDLILGNDSAGITLTSEGHIKLYGNTINLKGSDVKLKGPVSYTSGGSNQPETPARPEAVEPVMIMKLVPEESVQYLTPVFLRASD
ncbi:contractile injection system protein, VgrG/Pvc8 family [Aliidiomarina soli]|uniref:Gp5/Type VI secretion system Vgr protein OB-fold domain-containing protein n=1 Tax=Aliidiomarina soli TaxID=1928574 RepID=A0A432WIW7_9GAMM|nr:contractile injection system protein, VgrG/Pvc8 family [Aliidiomarina soli]RUO33750.1 hypothetical protein CWE14_04600 [Aliidiomarina soli]